jgi:hypothetical protein
VKNIPETHQALVLRTDFSDDSTWDSIRAAIRKPVGKFRAYFDFVELGRTFRVIPSEMWDVENNLSLANMDFPEFAGSTGPDGIFRGFPGG